MQERQNIQFLSYCDSWIKIYTKYYFSLYIDNLAISFVILQMSVVALINEIRSSGRESPKLNSRAKMRRLYPHSTIPLSPNLRARILLHPHYHSYPCGNNLNATTEQNYSAHCTTQSS